MSIALVASSGLKEGSNLTWTHTFTQNNLCTVQANNDSSNLPGTSDFKDSSGTPKTLNRDVVSDTATGKFGYAANYSLVVPSGFTSPLKGPAAFENWMAAEWSGNATTSVLDQSAAKAATTNGQTPYSTNSINSGANAGLALGTCTIASGGATEAITVTSTNWTDTFNTSHDGTQSNDSANDAGSCAYDLTSVASQTGLVCSWTHASGFYSRAAVISSYNVASSGGTPSSSDSVSLTDTANQIGINGPSDSASQTDTSNIGTGSTDSASVAEGTPGIGLGGSDSAALGDTSADYRATVLVDGPLRYWRLGDLSGSIAMDQSGNNQNGTYLTGTTLNQPGGLPGDSNPSVLFDGSAGTVRVPMVSMPNYASVEAWFKAPSVGGSARHIADLDPGTHDNLTIRNSGNIGFDAALTTAGIVTVTGGAVTANVWHHAVATFDGTTLSVYLDGVLSGSTSVSADTLLASGSGNGYIGSLNDVAAFFSGYIQDVAFYNFALSATQVAAHYAAGAVKQFVTTATSATETATATEATGIGTSSSDAATLNEQNAIKLLQTDSAAFAEQVAIAVTTSDSASTTDSGSVGGSSAPSSSDSATLAEQIKIALATSDGASLGEAMAVALGSTDAATLAELVKIALAANDGASLAEQVSIAVSTSTTESGSLTETGSVGGSSTPNSSDSATLAEQLKIALTAVDSAQLGEQMALALAHQDAATLQELVSVALAIADAASLSEGASVTQTGNSPSSSDTGALTDSASSTAAVSTSDVGAVAEAAAIALRGTDAAALTEQIGLALVAADNPSLTEQLHLAAANAASDPAGLGELQNVVASVLAAAESARVTDSARVTQNGVSANALKIFTLTVRSRSFVVAVRNLTFTVPKSTFAFIVSTP